MSTFDNRAKEWDKPDRVKLANNILLCMLAGLKLDKKMTAIDIGAGTGLITLEIAKKVKSITGLDSSQGMIDELKEKISHGEIKNADAVFYDIENDKNAVSPVDVIVSSMSMHHVEDTEKFAGVIYRMLKPGGQAAIADLEKEDGTFHAKSNSMGVKHSGFDRDKLAVIFKNAGFDKIRFSTAYKVKRDNKEYPIFLMLAERGK